MYHLEGCFTRIGDVSGGSLTLWRISGRLLGVVSDCEELSGGYSQEMMGLVLDWPNRGEVRRRRENVVM